MSNHPVKKGAVKAASETETETTETETNEVNPLQAELERVRAERDLAVSKAETAVQKQNNLLEKARETEGNQLAQDIAGIMVGMDEDARERLKTALIAADGQTIVSTAKQELLASEVAPLNQKIETYEASIASKDETIARLTIHSPLEAAYNKLGHETGARFAVPEIAKLFTVGEDGKPVARADGPSVGLDKAGKPLTFESAASEWLAANPIFSKSSTTALSPNSKGDDPTNQNGPTLNQLKERAKTDPEAKAALQKQIRDRLKPAQS